MIGILRPYQSSSLLLATACLVAAVVVNVWYALGTVAFGGIALLCERAIRTERRLIAQRMRERSRRHNEEMEWWS